MKHQNLLELCERLRDGASADIWYDAYSFNDDDAVERIERTQEAMQEAAKILEAIAGPPERGEFFHTVSTQEPKVFVNLSASDGLELADWSALIQIGNDESKFTCAYLDDDQLLELRDAIDRYLAIGTEADKYELWVVWGKSIHELSHYSFNSDQERDAFLQGTDEAQGWEDYATFETEAEAHEHMKELKEIEGN